MTVEIHSGNYTIGPRSISIELTADARGLTACRLLPKPVLTQGDVTNQYLLQAISELSLYFTGMSCGFRTHLAPDGTPFQLRVWEEAARIPYGKLQSYRDIATAIGKPTATRAVANALGANPLLLFIPCHRVIRHNGALGGFSCGIQWKTRFHELEGIACSRLSLI